MAVSRGEKNKQESSNTSLATDENQYIYSHDKLVTKLTIFLIRRRKLMNTSSLTSDKTKPEHRT